MAFCSRCGKEINDSAVICVHCGCAVAPLNQPAKPAVQDGGSFWLGLLGFFIPIAGLILYLTCKNDTPLKAKSAGLGALISVITSFVFWIIYIIVIILIASLL